MRPRSIFFLAGLLLALGIGWWLRPRPAAPGPGTPRESIAPDPSRQTGAPGTDTSVRSAPSEIAPPPAPSPATGGAATAPYDPADFPIAAPLNAAGATIMQDLAVLQQLFDAWRSNFPREGNPVGENADITAALTGANRLGLALVPRGHPALNERGELCDRWGTPFRFHQLSGEHMEILSAGPDRKFATADDAVLTPQ